MNERIAKLYDQAIVIEDGGDYVCGELDPAKFAELIIRECAMIATQQSTGYAYPVDVASYVTAGKVHSARMIKQQFGVE